MTSAFRLISPPSGTYNKAPPGIFAAGLPAFARGALGVRKKEGRERERERFPPPFSQNFVALKKKKEKEKNY